MTYRDEISVGSIVQVGAGGDPLHHMTWLVLRLAPDGNGITYATIRSGGVGQTRTYPLSKLTIFRVQENNA